MLVSIAAYALIWGWRFAVGFVLLLLVHELGHVIQLRREGIDAGAPMFIPFLGAVVAMKQLPKDAAAEARVGLAGPVLGSAAALVPLGIYAAGGSDLFLALAYVGFLLNLFNLIPIGILDGGSMWRAIKTMRLGGTPGKAQLATAAYLGLAALLVIGMFAAHVPQHRL
jgi:Zn-dependent protease